MPLVSNSASAILELLRYVGCDVTTYLPWTVWVNNCHSTKTILPCISAWNDRWSGKFCDRKLLGILWLFNILSAFSFILWGKVAFFKISLLVAAFTTFDFSLALREVLWEVMKVSVERVLAAWDQPWWQSSGHLSRRVVRSRAMDHLLGCYLGMDVVSWLDSCQPQSTAILGNNRWGQVTSDVCVHFVSVWWSRHRNTSVVNSCG